MGLVISDPRLVVRTGDKLYADEPVKVSYGDFDGKLIKRKSGVWDIEVFMKLQFFFEKGSRSQFKRMESDKSHKWTETEKHKFMRDWHTNVRKAWNRKNVAKLADKKPFNVTCNFYLQEGGWLWDHFEIDVTKSPFMTGGQANVLPRPFDGDVQLEDMSATPVSKSIADIVGEPSHAGYVSAAHEFGHMIGIGRDDYDPKSPHSKDKKSVMHMGPLVRQRHYDILKNWANLKIDMV